MNQPVSAQLLYANAPGALTGEQTRNDVVTVGNASQPA